MKTLKITAADFETGEAFTFGSMRWRGVAVEENGVKKVYFYDCCHLDRIVEVTDVKPGDYVWCHAAGTDTTAGKCSVPNDPRLAYLWEQGFRKSTRLTKSDLEEYGDHTVYNYVYEELGGDFTPSYYENGYTEGSWAMVGLRHYKISRNDEIMFEGVIGRINGTDNGIVRWYMDKKCTLEEIKQAFGDVDIVPPNCIAVPMTCC